MTRYLTEFRLRTVRGGLTGWTTMECEQADTLDGVAAMIGTYSDQEQNGLVIIPADGGGTIRVTRMTDSGCTDWTEDALRYFAQRALDVCGEWPWWLAELAPAYVREDAA